MHSLEDLLDMVATEAMDPAAAPADCIDFARPEVVALQHRAERTIPSEEDGDGD